MDFVNHTPFPALAFEGIDQEGQGFHVVVLRQTLSFASGALEYADTQAPLCEADMFFGDPNRSSVRQESDLCHYKPRCDVIVNATAYAPQGRPVREFDVRLVVKRMRGAADEYLIDKQLKIFGDRNFVKKSVPVRVFQKILQYGSLGLIRLNPWKLTRPGIVNTVAVRFENAYGGQCRIDAADRAAKKVGKAHRLSREQLKSHPDGHLAPERQPVMHKAFSFNLHGKGFVDMEYVRATSGKRIAAPQIERPGFPWSAKRFWQAMRGKLPVAGNAHSPTEPAGFGICAKVSPARSALCGSVDQAFIDSDAALPAGFDFGYWNAAPHDQQTEHLGFDEIIELTNLCMPGMHCSDLDAAQNTVLRIEFLPHECFVLCRQLDGNMFEQAMVIDTIIVEPDEATLTLVWRLAWYQSPDAPMRACEARMRSSANACTTGQENAHRGSSASCVSEVAGATR